MKYAATATIAFVFATALAATAGAQSLATPGPTPSSWGRAVPGIGPMTLTENVRDAQQQLRTLGFYHGPLDGRLDANTRAAIAAFQQRNGPTRSIGQPLPG